MALLVADESGFPPCPVPRCGEKPAGSQEQLRARRVGVGPGKGILAEKGKAPGQGGSPAASPAAGRGLLPFPSVLFQMLVDQSDSYPKAVYSSESVSELFEMGLELPQTLHARVRVSFWW